jgi:hypothetical protein
MYLLFILTANGFSPGGSGTTITHNTEILSFRTISIVLVLKTNQGKHDVSETGSVSVLRCGKILFYWVPYKELSPITGRPKTQYF